jgi:hypothetical protein
MSARRDDYQRSTVDREPHAVRKTRRISFCPYAALSMNVTAPPNVVPLPLGAIVRVTVTTEANELADVLSAILTGSHRAFRPIVPLERAPVDLKSHPEATRFNWIGEYTVKVVTTLANPRRKIAATGRQCCQYPNFLKTESKRLMAYSVT